MDKSAWESLLSAWASEAAKRAGMPDGAQPFSGLGFLGATEKELREAESRLGCSLPPSYRDFLKCTNGLRQPNGVFAARGGDFWPVEQVDWFTVRNSEWVEIWMAKPCEIPDSLYFVYGPSQDTVNFRAEYLSATLEISHDGDASIYLLNPRVIAADGEWEAWFLATWAPGATRYRSFADMMLDHHRAFREGLDGF